MVLRKFGANGALTAVANRCTIKSTARGGLGFCQCWQFWVAKMAVDDGGTPFEVPTCPMLAVWRGENGGGRWAQGGRISYLRFDAA